MADLKRIEAREHLQSLVGQEIQTTAKSQTRSFELRPMMSLLRFSLLCPGRDEHRIRLESS